MFLAHPFSICYTATSNPGGAALVMNEARNILIGGTQAGMGQTDCHPASPAGLPRRR
jgi:hypothetical protein